MRIADHAPALQSSQALQQPASTTHQQQILSGEMASAALSKEVRKRNNEVTNTHKAEQETIRGESEGKNRRSDSRKSNKEPGEIESIGKDPDRHPSEPGNGNLLDVTV